MKMAPKTGVSETREKIREAMAKSLKKPASKNPLLFISKF